MQPQYTQSDYVHSMPYRVRSHECDRQGVVHNARYLEMLEIARIEFCRDVMKIPIDHDTFAHHHKFFFVRNALNYFSPARFDDQLIIYTRVASVGNTSITLEQIINMDSDGKRMVECESVMVSVDEKSDQPKEIDAELRNRISNQ